MAWNMGIQQQHDADGDKESREVYASGSGVWGLMFGTVHYNTIKTRMFRFKPIS